MNLNVVALNRIHVFVIIFHLVDVGFCIMFCTWKVQRIWYDSVTLVFALGESVLRVEVTEIILTGFAIM